MDTKRPYQQMANNLNEMNSEQLLMSQQQPLAYNNMHVAAATAPPPATATMVAVTTNEALPPGMPVMPQPVGPESCEMTCPHCRCRIRTRVNHRATAKTHFACLLLSWTLCCCCLPYCMNSCRNANHFCSMCGAFLGTYYS